MRAVVQRVSRARVVVEGSTVGEIGAGLLVLLGVANRDDEEDAERLAGKVARLRIFEDDHGKFDRTVLDTGGGILAVSQFTLIADYLSEGETASGRLIPAWKGNRPSFMAAARPEHAEPVYDRFVETLHGLGVPVQTGVFGARMEVEMVNDGPVTIILDV
jgi:D-tyrosyl-tRNA(Tyr) deacylase